MSEEWVNFYVYLLILFRIHYNLRKYLAHNDDICVHPDAILVVQGHVTSSKSWQQQSQ